MTTQPKPLDISALADRCLANSQRWFPQNHVDHRHAITHCTLGLAGEAGEVANKVKKLFGYTGDQQPPELIAGITEELIDALIYNLVLLRLLDADIPREVEAVVAKCMARWEPGYTWDTVPIGHNVPGSGEIVYKRSHASGWHVTFRRTELFPGDEWSAWRRGDESVPVAISKHGLAYPAPKNVNRAVGVAG